MMKKLVLGFTFLLAFLCAFALNAQATQINGVTSFSGTFDSSPAALDLATAFSSFTNVVVSTDGGVGDYASIPGSTNVNISTFTFLPNINSLISDFWVINHDNKTFSYDLLTSAIKFSDFESIIIKGTGIARITDFENTLSTWVLSATRAEDRSTFTLSTTVVSNPVPEPATMILFGLGLLGVAGIGRKKS